MVQFLTNIVQLGWNHQLAVIIGIQIWSQFVLLKNSFTIFKQILDSGFFGSSASPLSKLVSYCIFLFIFFAFFVVISRQSNFSDRVRGQTPRHATWVGGLYRQVYDPAENRLMVYNRRWLLSINGHLKFVPEIECHVVFIDETLYSQKLRIIVLFKASELSSVQYWCFLLMSCVFLIFTLGKGHRFSNPSWFVEVSKLFVTSW